MELADNNCDVNASSYIKGNLWSSPPLTYCHAITQKHTAFYQQSTNHVFLKDECCLRISITAWEIGFDNVYNWNYNN